MDAGDGVWATNDLDVVEVYLLDLQHLGPDLVQVARVLQPLPVMLVEPRGWLHLLLACGLSLFRFRFNRFIPLLAVRVATVQELVALRIEETHALALARLFLLLYFEVVQVALLIVWVAHDVLLVALGLALDWI